MVRSGDADLAITIGLQEQSGVSSNRIAVENFFVALSSDDSLSVKQHLQISDLHHRRLALLERHVNPSVHDRIQQLFATDGIHPTEVQPIQRAEEAAALILQTGCVALLTKGGAWRISDGLITLRPLQEERLELVTYVSARLEEESRLISAFFKAYKKRLESKPTQANLSLAG